MNGIVLPTDVNALVTLLISHAFIAALMSWVFEHIPFMRNAARPDWQKLSLVALICLIWSFVVTVVGLKHIPLTPDEIYTWVLLSLVVLFDNQAVYALVNQIPALRDFILMLSGKQTPTAENA